MTDPTVIRKILDHAHRIRAHWAAPPVRLRRDRFEGARSHQIRGRLGLEASAEHLAIAAHELLVGRRQFRDHLRCGLLEYGFIRIKCNGCCPEPLTWPTA